MSPAPNPPCTQLTRLNNEHGEEHWLALQQLVAYLRKTRDTHALKVDSHRSQIIQTFVDADWNGTKLIFFVLFVLSKSTTGFIVFSGRTPISWCSKTQKAVARSTMESELIAYSSATQETVFIAMLARAMRMKHADQTEVIINKEKQTPTPEEHNGAYYAAEIWSDSQNALACAREPELEGWIRNKVRHVRTAWFWFKQYAQSREIIPRFCRGVEQCADILTKGMGTAKGGQESKTSQAASLFHRHARFCLSHPPETSRLTTAASARSNKSERAESKKRKHEAASAFSMQVAGEGEEDED